MKNTANPSQESTIKKLETELKLQTNKHLYEQGYITREMYIKAKHMILTKKEG